LDYDRCSGEKWGDIPDPREWQALPVPKPLRAKFALPFPEMQEECNKKICASLFLLLPLPMPAAHLLVQIAELDNVSQGDGSPSLHQRKTLRIASHLGWHNDRTFTHQDHCRIHERDGRPVAHMDSERMEWYVSQSLVNVTCRHFNRIIPGGSCGGPDCL
jgi:hypothetical protein